MSAETVHAVLDRAMQEPEFRELLFSNPEQALAGQSLTSDELTTLKSLPRAEFEQAMNGTLEQRRSLGIRGKG